MSGSPPKRMTRARARAVAVPKVTTKITTPAAKATRTAASKRKTATEDANLDSISIAAPPPPMKTLEPAKTTRGRPKKAVSNPVPSEQALSKEEEGGPAEQTKAEPPKSRGRPKRAAPQAAKAEAETETAAPVSTRTNTRTRAAAAAAPKSSVPRKKVTFQDDQADKENQIPLATSPKRPTKLTGVKAKPVRKPAAARTTRRGKKAVEEDQAEQQPQEKTVPLSPKKITQVSSVTSEEDELDAGKKTPVRNLTKKTSDQTTVDKTDETTSVLPSSPTKSIQTTSIMGSPARRPPPSPFKDALKDSPRRVNLGDSILLPPNFSSTSTPFKTIGRGDTAASMKKSLLQSPARRPGTVPHKPTAPRSPGKAFVNGPGTDFVARYATPSRINKMPSFRPQDSATSAFRAAGSPDRSIKPHKIMPDEQPEQKPIPQPSFSPLVVEKDAESGDGEISLAPSPPASPMSPTQRAAHPVEGDGTAAATGSEEQSQPDNPTAEDPFVTNHGVQTTADENGEFLGQAELPIQNDFNAASPATQYPSDDSGSEDELQTPGMSHTPRFIQEERLSLADSEAIGTPTPSVFKSSSRQHAGEGFFSPQKTEERFVPDRQPTANVPFTPLAHQFGNWKASSPEKTFVHAGEPVMRDIFALPAMLPRPQPDRRVSTMTNISPTKTSFFEDEMSVREQADLSALADAQWRQVDEDDDDDAISILAPTELSEASQEYGDENALPTESQAHVNTVADSVDPASISIATCTPAKVFAGHSIREIHTVSKVPLRAISEDSPSRPLRMKKRSRSVSSGPSSPRKSGGDHDALVLGRSKSVNRISSAPEPLRPLPLSEATSLPENVTPVKKPPVTATPQKAPRWSLATAGIETPAPASTPLPKVNPDTLRGAVVYVDVHTAEGADASGIFVELLTSMGAKCVKQWHWNPMTEGAADHDADTPAGKVGITHVVFKDGGKRTLEKVRESKGVVLCVGVGWVLDCERTSTWLDEARYGIDLALIPRGGHNRRKSMEPRALHALTTTPVAPSANDNAPEPEPALPAADTKGSPPTFSPTQEFLTFSSPARRQSSLFTPVPVSKLTREPVDHDGEGSPSEAVDQWTTIPTSNLTTTPEDKSQYQYPSPSDGDTDPSTPYFLHPAQIVQRTCPPKQSHHPQGPSVFGPASNAEESSANGNGGNVNMDVDGDVRRRLLFAKRKSLQWAPRVGSPLGREV
ncbi:MAG: hypothetical protein M1817_000171 [Caeruleum heppii]|nr:MAG: hypothetical protein M1817_000171 [Caeruleum heppii]